MIAQISFLIMGVLAVFLSVLMISRKQPVASAILLVVVMVLLAGMYGVLGAHFSAVSQIIVYAGAIMVVFIFVIMLLNIPKDQLNYGKLTVVEMFIALIGLAVALFLGTKVGQGELISSLDFIHLSRARAPYFPEQMNENVRNVAASLFTDYLWSFELISILILVSIVGAVVIAKKESPQEPQTLSENEVSL